MRALSQEQIVQLGIVPANAVTAQSHQQHTPVYYEITFFIIYYQYFALIIRRV